MTEQHKSLKERKPDITYDFSKEEVRQQCFTYKEKELTLQKFEMTPEVMTMSRVIYKDSDSSIQTPEDSLEFDSNFECGNVYKVKQVNPREYQLELRHDSGTEGHPQWYFFSCKRLTPGKEYRFHITNLLKKTSSYSFGLKPLVYFSRQKIWRRIGKDILYRKTSAEREDGKFYFQLTFSFTPSEEDLSSHEEKVFFCHHYPYTNSMLSTQLDVYEKDPRIKQFFQRRELVRTSLGYMCEKILIGEDMKNPNVVVIIARQHPGETTSSWKMKGVLDFLTNPEDEEAKILRSKFLFYIVPMINIDGVQLGNYRCSSIGEDLNRQWNEPTFEKNPVVYMVKKEMSDMQDLERREIVFFLDLHGHSKTRDVFFYANNSLNRDHKIAIRSFPKLMARYCPNYFSYRNSSFKMGKKKRETARYVAYKELRVMHSYTCESSFCGPSKGSFIGMHFTVSDYIEVGKLLMKYILKFTDVQSKEMREVLYELRLIFPESKVKRKKKRIVKRKQKKLQKRFGNKNDRFFNKKKKKINEAPKFTLVTSSSQKQHQQSTTPTATAGSTTSDEPGLVQQQQQQTQNHVLRRKKMMKKKRKVKEFSSGGEEEELKLGITNVRNSPFLRKGIRRLEGESTNEDNASNANGDSDIDLDDEEEEEIGGGDEEKGFAGWFNKKTVISFSLGLAVGAFVGSVIRMRKR